MIKKITNIWDFKYLIYNLVLRDLKVKYKGSALGFLWSLLNPLLMLVVYTVAFQYVIKMRVPNFPIFLLCALLPWSYLTTSLAMGTGAITDNSNLVKKVYFPREVLPLSVVLVNLFHFLLTFAVLIPSLFFFKVTPGPALLFLPVLLLFQTLFVLGLTLMSAALNVYYRDVKHITEVILQLWFWATPIIWSLDMLPEKYQTLAYLNPFTPFVVAYRDIFLRNRLPELPMLAAIVVGGVVVFLLGAVVFQHKQRRFAEEI